MSTQELLKPCPFCGSEVEIEHLGDHSRSTIYQCTNCGCSLETGEEWSHGRDWNRRANDARLTELSAELEAVKAREAKLREALEPFSVVAIQAEQAWTSGQYYQPDDYVRPSIRLKHFIAARAALGGEG